MSWRNKYNHACPAVSGRTVDEWILALGSPRGEVKGATINTINIHKFRPEAAFMSLNLTAADGTVNLFTDVSHITWYANCMLAFAT